MKEVDNKAGWYRPDLMKVIKTEKLGENNNDNKGTNQNS